MAYVSVLDSIELKIKKSGRGRIYFISDFLLFGYEAVKKNFQRLEASHTLIRLARGIYLYPKIDKKLGLGVLYPSIDEIAKEVAKRDKARIVPTGTYALNRLGLSTQIPTNTVFLTDGTPRKINVGNGKGILFKRTTPNNLAYKNYAIMLIVSALKELKKENVTEEIISKIKKIISNESKGNIENDLKLAPIWIQDLILVML